MSDFYNWEKTLSYDADFTLVVGARGVGKTYGLRKQFISDYAKDGSHFVEIVRHAEQLKGDERIQNGYFDKLAEDHDIRDKWIFKTEGVRAFIAPKCAEDEKPAWDLLGYFVALTQANKLKQRTFTKVRRVLFDEALIDPLLAQYQRYLTGEFALLLSVVDTVSRERKGAKGIRPRIYALGNAVDLLNPYFVEMGVGDKPKQGYRWYKGKTMLLHYVESAEYSRDKATDTVVGRLSAGSESAQANIANEFIRHDADLFGKKPARADFSFGIFHKKRKYGVWLDITDGYYYINRQIPKNTSRPIYALTVDDERPNYIQASRMQKSLKGFVDLYYMGVLKYENEAVRNGFLEALTLFGVR